MNTFRLVCSNDDHIYIDQPTKVTDTYYLKLNNGRKIGYYDVEKDYQGWSAWNTFILLRMRSHKLYTFVNKWLLITMMSPLRTTKIIQAY